MFKIIENFKILDLGFVDNGNLKGKISPSPKQGPSDPIVYTFSTLIIFFSNQPHFSHQKKQNVPLTMNWADVLFSRHIWHKLKLI